MVLTGGKCPPDTGCRKEQNPPLPPVVSALCPGAIHLSTFICKVPLLQPFPTPEGPRQSLSREKCSIHCSGCTCHTRAHKTPRLCHGASAHRSHVADVFTACTLGTANRVTETVTCGREKLSPVTKSVQRVSTRSSFTLLFRNS